MGTNYYLRTNICPTCKKPESERHIGNSSAGWCFSLHVYPEDGINDLEDWERLMASLPNTDIKDEYGRDIDVDELLRVITRRKGPGKATVPPGYRSREEFDSLNHSEPGPNGLFRHNVEPGHCIKHGAGTWDCIVGDFS